MKKINFHFVGLIAIILSIVLLIWASFIEKESGSATAKGEIYYSFGFTCSWVIIGLYTLYSIYKSSHFKRIVFCLLHLAIVLIIAGFITTTISSSKGILNLQKSTSHKMFVKYDEETLKREFVPLGFELTLLDCEIETYMGSKNPSGYITKLQLVDYKEGLQKEVTVKMNQPLIYNSFRFFLSSIDANTGSSEFMVNYDPYGMPITYFGYLALTIAMILSFMDKKSRIRKLIKLLSEQSVKRLVIVILLLSAQLGYASKIKPHMRMDNQVADFFGQIWCQDSKGRLKPINTVSTELCLKITGKNSFEDLNPNQLFLSIMIFPDLWKDVELIQIKHKELRDFLKIKNKRAKLSDLFTGGKYKLDSLLRIANSKQTNAFDKEVQAVTERINLFSLITKQHYLNLFPNRQNSNSLWLNPNSELKEFDKNDSLFIKGIVPLFFNSAVKKDRKQAHEYASAIAKYQMKYEPDELPSITKRKAEIIYFKYNPYSLLFKLYGTIGFMMILLSFLSFKNKRKNRWNLGLKFIIGFLWIVHTFFLILRGYIANHIPVSNGYEIMLFISWTSTIIAFIVLKKEFILSGSALLFSCLGLLVASFSWMNPEISNIVPVLNSNWLSVHVSTIMLAYSFAGVVALIGLINLFILALGNQKFLTSYKKRVNYIINASELMLWLSVYLMVLGIITGSVWANDSWGNYWSWDPKEVWALISLMTYSLLTHFYKKTSLVYLSIFKVLSFGSILITYFGVNYYFGGKHAYSGASSFSMPSYVYFLIAIFLIVSILNILRKNRYESL